MTDIVNIPDLLPISQYPALGSANFNQEAYNYATSVPPAVARMREVAVACRTCAIAAREQADAAMSYRNQAANSAAAAEAAKAISQAAASSAETAKNQAQSAAASAASSAQAVDQYMLGPKTVPPITDNQGGAIKLGAMYINVGSDTTLNNRWYWWGGNVLRWVPGVGDLPATFMPRGGGVFTGHIEVPSGATGNQAPRASEVVSRKITYAGIGTNMNALPLINGAWSGRDWVNAPSAESPWWYVEQIVHEENYVTQTALGLTDATPKYFRIQVGGVWQQWRRMLDAIDLREKVFASSTGAGPGDAKLYFLDPSKGSIHQLTVQYNTYFTGALRGIGDQLTLRLKFSGGAWPISFNTNFRFPAGTVFPTYVAGQTLTLTFVNTEGSFIDAFIVGVHNP
ncbi:MAG: hypothetical protein PBV86_16105 [Delftia lacustris]|uniref:hypothetical protein n=1 Tax=Delftia TaxID=80865 RepID=UPI001BCF337C|nr:MULTISPECIES: hypothetical protein [unclassified Delftia]WON86348.1 hypothetical protein OK021_16425 [Delftia sp. UGAL515B_04]